MKTFILLADSSALEVDNFTFDQHFSISSTTPEEVQNLWNNILTPENLSHIQILQDGIVVARYRDCVLSSVQASNLSSERIVGHFYLTGTPQRSSDEVYEQAYNVISEGF